MTNSITTVVEVMKNIHDTVIMASWQPMSKPTKLSWQRHWQVMMLWFMSRCHKQRHLKQCLICIQNVITERKTLNKSCHKHA